MKTAVGVWGVNFPLSFTKSIHVIKTLAKDVFYLEERLELSTLTFESFCERVQYLGSF